MMCNSVPRFALLMVITLFKIRQLTANYQLAMPLDVDLNKALYGHSLVNISGLTMENCLEHCLANCLCLSFQICVKTTKCQLCSSNKYLNSQAMQESEGCTTYNFRDQGGKKVTNQQCDSLMSIFNCCLKSNPCLNGGTCISTLSSSNKRFRCQCPDGYTGQQCEHPMRSCRGYSNGNDISGYYAVLDVNNNTFKVFCHFDRSSPMTSWTLVQSYNVDNKYLFRRSPLSKDSPENQNDPYSLQYRLSKSRMESIQQDSTKWRHTCRYEPDGGVVSTSYLRASNTELNILKDNKTCIKVEYMNVAKYSCTNCTVYMFPMENMLLYNFGTSKQNICNNQTTSNSTCVILYDHNFCLYQSQNTQHFFRTWFGAEDGSELRQ